MAVSEAKHLAIDASSAVPVAPRSMRRGDVVDDERAACDVHRHVGQHELDPLERGDGLVELPGAPGRSRWPRRGRPGRCPTACAPIVGRDWSSVRIAILKPSPSSPRRFSTGISQSVKWSATVGRPVDAHLLLLLADGEAGHAGLDEERGDALGALGRARWTNTVMTPACEPLVTTSWSRSGRSGRPCAPRGTERRPRRSPRPARRASRRR